MLVNWTLIQISIAILLNSFLTAHRRARGIRRGDAQRAHGCEGCRSVLTNIVRHGLFRGEA